MHHMARDELAHARWKSRRLLAVVSLSFGVGEPNCLQPRSQGALGARLQLLAGRRYSQHKTINTLIEESAVLN